MTDLDRELRDRLHTATLPPAPTSIHEALERTVRVTPRRSRSDRRRTYFLIGIAAVLATTGLVLATTGGVKPKVSPSPSAPSLIAESSPTGTPTQITPSFPAQVDGLHVYSVSELLSDRTAGKVSGGPIALAGYWSVLGLAHSCVPPPKGTGELEMWCGDGESGITEADEQIMRIVNAEAGQVQPAVGAHLTPFLPNADWVAPLYTQTVWVNGQQFPPVPIVVIGHLDDPRAAKCRPEARKLCQDRFVVDQLVSFDAGAVPTPAITPTPSPFPFDSPPPLTLDVAGCAASIHTHDFSFLGWMSAADLNEQISEGPIFGPFDTLAVAISRNPVPASMGWSRDKSGKRYRLMSRRVCVAREWDSGAIQFDDIKGSFSRLYEDGTSVPIKDPF